MQSFEDVLVTMPAPRCSPWTCNTKITKKRKCEKEKKWSFVDIARAGKEVR
jgi:hypothetical protein